MKDVTLLLPAGAKVINSYGDGVFRVSGDIYEGALLISPKHACAWHPTPADHSAFTLQDFAFVADLTDAEIILIGTGGKLIFIPPALRQQVKHHYGCAIDVMDTGAACRTYNIMMAEGRRVAAALLPVM